MSSESNIPIESALVEISPQTKALVEQEIPHETPDVKRETEALVEAIKKRAQAEIQAAGDLTRDAYLKAVRQARETIEKDKLINPERIQESVEMIQREAEKNWQAIAREIEDIGVRLADTAKSTGEALISFFHKSDQA